jgi:DNA-binding response OmpR family regulator
MDKKPTILIVDDQPDLLENIGLILETEGYQILTATDGLVALEQLESQPVDLILADIAMPNMNGYQLFERIRENSHWLTIPFLFLTARSFDSDIRYGKALGVDDYLTKPIRPEDLLAAVQGKLRRAEQLRQLSQPGPVGSGARPGALKVGPLEINVEQHRVLLYDQEIKLSAREFLLLEYLLKNKDKICSAPEIVQVTHQLETDHIEAGSLLGPLLHSLRRKLATAGEPATNFVENVRGVGYRLSLPES